MPYPANRAPAEALLLKEVLGDVEWNRLAACMTRERAPSESIVEFLERRKALARPSLSVVKLVARADLTVEVAAPLLLRHRVAEQLAPLLTLHEEPAEDPSAASEPPPPLDDEGSPAVVAGGPAASRNAFQEFAASDSAGGAASDAAAPARPFAPAAPEAAADVVGASWDDAELNAIFDAVSTLLPPLGEASTQVASGGPTEPLEVHQQPPPESEDGSSAFADTWLRSAARGKSDDESVDEILPPGSRMGRYELDQLLGRGGFGTVYASTHPALQVPVAVKVMRCGLLRGDEKEAFLREARLVAQLNHPSIVRVWDFDEDHRGRPYLVLEYVDGATLLELLRERGRLPPAAALCVARDVALGLQAAARLGIVHKDVKPANVLIARDGTVKLTDFGVAAFSDRRKGDGAAQAASGGAVCGTIDYMPPEQARGEAVDGRADMYSLGVTLYQAATGRLPFTGESVAQILVKCMNGAATPPRDLVPSIPEAVSALILKMMARTPEERYGNYVELLAALDAVAEALQSASGAAWSAEAQASSSAPHDPEASASVWDRFKRGSEWNTLG